VYTAYPAIGVGPFRDGHVSTKQSLIVAGVSDQQHPLLNSFSYQQANVSSEMAWTVDDINRTVVSQATNV
jgi:hypothetical protein